MTQEKKANAHEAYKDFIIERSFDAPRDLVFEAWTDIKHLKHWMTPKDFKNEYSYADIRPDGWNFYKMTTPDGTEMWGKVHYEEITKPDKLVYIQYFADPDGNIIKPPFPGDWPIGMRTTVLFEDQKGKTKIHLTWALLPGVTPEEIDTFVKEQPGMTIGWSGTFELLDDYLAGLK